MNHRLQIVIVLLAAGLMLLSLRSLAQEADHPPPLTLNLTDVDIHQFLRLVHEISGMNIVVAPDVRGRVTAIMRDVPWEQALDAVLKTSGFISVRDDNILRVMTVEGSRRELMQREGLEQAQRIAVPLQVCTFRLNNADVGDTARILQSFLSPRGRIIADTRTNTLIVSDVPQVLQNLGITPMPPSRGRCFSATGIKAQ